jgi:hypothetical protein
MSRKPPALRAVTVPESPDPVAIATPSGMSLGPAATEVVVAWSLAGFAAAVTARLAGSTATGFDFGGGVDGDGVDEDAGRFFLSLAMRMCYLGR